MQQSQTGSEGPTLIYCAVSAYRFYGTLIQVAPFLSSQRATLGSHFTLWQHLL